MAGPAGLEPATAGLESKIRHQTPRALKYLSRALNMTSVKMRKDRFALQMTQMDRAVVVEAPGIEPEGPGRQDDDSTTTGDGQTEGPPDVTGGQSRHPDDKVGQHPDTFGHDPCCTYVASPDSSPPELRQLAAAWPLLSADIRNAIMSLVNSAKGGGL